MSLPYPQNTIWYVEASRADGSELTCGSAVAVWLQKTGQPQTRRKYLLTCAHIVRGTVPGSLAKDREAGFGPVLPQIEVWGPDTGYSPESKIAASIATDVKPVDPVVVPPKQRLNAADDWIVLKLESEQASQAMESVREWATSTPGDLTVLGYPGGKRSFQQSKVIPTQGDDLTFRDLYHGVVRLNGMETRPGMSGGGLFDEQNCLVGIHRSRLDDVLQCHSVSLDIIREQLRASGFDHVALPPVHEAIATSPAIAFPGRPRHSKALIGLAVTLVAIVTVTAIVLVGLLARSAPDSWALYDTRTQERIHRRFSLTVTGVKYPDQPAGSYNEFEGPDLSTLARDEIAVDCIGFERRPTHIDIDKTEGRLWLTRYTAEYSKGIQPEPKPCIAALPPSEMSSRVDDVTLFVHNSTDRTADIVLYSFSSTHSISGDEPSENCAGPYFRLAPKKALVCYTGLDGDSKRGYYVYISLFGERARSGDNESDGNVLLLNSRFPIIWIKQMDPLQFGIVSRDDDPRDDLDFVAEIEAAGHRICRECCSGDFKTLPPCSVHQGVVQ